MRIKSLRVFFAVVQLVLLAACGDLASQTPNNISDPVASITSTVAQATTARTTQSRPTPTTIEIPTILATPALSVQATTARTVASIRVMVATPVVASTPTPEKTGQPSPNTSTPTAQPTATVITSITAASPISPLVNGPDSEELAFIDQLNRFRQSNGRSTLTFDPLLFRSARWMAEDMAIHNYISHTDSLSRTIATRIKSFGYTGAFVGENIAGGFETAAGNLTIWQSDDIHKNNLLGASYSKVGVGRYYNKASLNGWYWVLDLG